MADRDAQASVTPPHFDARAQREAVSVAERMVRAYLEGRHELVGELAAKMDELDRLGNYVAAVAAARDWLSACPSGPPGADERRRMADALAGDPLASLLT